MGAGQNAAQPADAMMRKLALTGALRKIFETNAKKVMKVIAGRQGAAAHQCVIE
jgi:hypothetical protein